MNLSQKKICVFGPGLSGKSTLEFLGHQGALEVVVIGSGEPKSWTLREEFYRAPFKALNQDDPICKEELLSSDLIILSPGIAREHELLRDAVKEGVKLWSEIELAYHFFKAPIVALTGTNGKTTTVTLLGELFKSYGLRTFVGGNIGVPFLEALKQQYDLAVLELSSFQLESLEDFHAEISAILNVFPNHGERYRSHENYRLAKWNITQNQNKTDFLFTGEAVGRPLQALGSPREIKLLPDYFEDDLGQEIIDFEFSKIKMVGVHNRKNIWFAWKIFSTFLKDEPKDKLAKIFKKVTYNFSGVEHRVEAFGRYRGYPIFNDAKSTNWQATMTALRAVGELKESTTLIMGGQLRGSGDLPNEQQLLELKESTNECLVIGEAGKILSDFDNYFKEVKTIEAAKEYIDTESSIEAILFSPGYPSFDQFKNYAHRGEVFKCLFK